MLKKIINSLIYYIKKWGVKLKFKSNAKIPLTLSRFKNEITDISKKYI